MGVRSKKKRKVIKCQLGAVSRYAANKEVKTLPTSSDFRSIDPTN